MWSRAYGGLELLRAQAITTTGNQTGVDISTYASLMNREMVVFADVGTMTTTTTATVAITESDTSGGTYAAPANGTASAVITAAGLSTLRFRAAKAFIRAEVTVNAAGSIPMSVIGVALKREA